MRNDYLEMSALAGENDGVRYVSGMHVNVDIVHNGRVLPVCRSSAGRPKYQITNIYESANWLRDFIGKEEIESFIIEMDGQRLENHWQFVETKEIAEQAAVKHGAMVLQHDLRPVRVTMHTRIDGTAIFERWLEIENTGGKPAALSFVSPISGLVWKSDNAKDQRLGNIFELVYFDDQRFGYEGSLVKKPLPIGKFTHASTTGRCGWGVPFCMVRNTLTGESMMASLEWSSNWSFTVTNLSLNDGRSAALAFSMGPRASAPIKVIRAGETLKTPIVHFGIARGDMDACALQMHEHIRCSVVKQDTEREFLPVVGGRVVEGGMDWLKHEVDMAAMMGMEHFLVDAGWYGYEFNDWYNTTGDWNVGDWLENTLDDAREYIHSKGMKFGLWMEPESAGLKSTIAKEHPDWFMSRDGKGAKPVAGNRLLDLAKPVVREWVEAQVLAIIENYKPDVVKIDYNCGEIDDMGENEVDGYYENAMWGHVQALYDIFDKVCERFPHVYLENCAAGGGRNELGLMRRFDICAHSDYTVTPRSLFAVNNLSFLFPPELMRYYFAHWWGYHLYADYDFQIRTALLSNPLFVGFGAEGDPVNTEEKAKITHNVGLYKRFIRPLMKGCRTYHHTGILAFEEEHEWCIVEYGAENCERSIISVFRLQSKTGSGVSIRPKGIRAGCRYWVTRDNDGQRYAAMGSDLMNAGIYIDLQGENTSELIMLEKAED